LLPTKKAGGAVEQSWRKPFEANPVDQAATHQRLPNCGALAPADGVSRAVGMVPPFKCPPPSAVVRSLELLPELTTFRTALRV
jgi:hypothetical protein